MTLALMFALAVALASSPYPLALRFEPDQLPPAKAFLGPRRFRRPRRLYGVVQSRRHLLPASRRTRGDGRRADETGLGRGDRERAGDAV